LSTNSNATSKKMEVGLTLAGLPCKYPVRYLPGIYHSRYLPEKFDRKLKLVNTQYLPLGIYLEVFTITLMRALFGLHTAQCTRAAKDDPGLHN